MSGYSVAIKHTTPGGGTVYEEATGMYVVRSLTVGISTLNKIQPNAVQAKEIGKQEQHRKNDGDAP